MLYANLEIIRPLYGMEKKISSKLLKVGDRFVYPGHKSLMFKTNANSENGNFLCCDEEGIIKWIDGEISVIKINGVSVTLRECSIKFKDEFLMKDNYNKNTIVDEFK